MTAGRVALALALLLGLQPVATDLYLPSLPLLKHELAATMAQAHLTLSALILSFGFGQLFWGPVADRVGRRPVLLIGLLLFVAASMAATLSGGIEALIFWRAVQGACLAAAVVCARAMVRDLYRPHEGVQIMSRGLSGLGLIALVSPAFGGLAAQFLGFRGTLAAVAAVGAAVLVFVWLAVDETLPQRNPQATRWRDLARNWWRIAAHPGFRAWAGLVAGTYGGLFVMLSSSSFVLIDLLGLSRTAYGGMLAGCSLSYLAGTFLCRYWAARVGAQRAAARAAVFTLAGGASMAALSLAGAHSAWAIVLPCWIYAVGHGVHQPCGQAGVVAPFPAHAGAASALSGFALSVVAFCVGSLMGALLHDSVLPLTLGMGLGALFTAAMAWGPVRRHGASGAQA